MLNVAITGEVCNVSHDSDLGPLAAEVELRLRTAIDASYILATEQLERVTTDTEQFATGTKKNRRLVRAGEQNTTWIIHVCTHTDGTPLSNAGRRRVGYQPFNRRSGRGEAYADDPRT